MTSAPEEVVHEPTMASPEEDEPPTSVLTQPEDESTKELDTSATSEDTSLEDVDSGNRGHEVEISKKFPDENVFEIFFLQFG
jgi:hypothetical protein